MAQADPTGARKRTTQKTTLTRDEDAFLNDFSLPSILLSSALDPVESHKSGSPLGVAQALTPLQPLSEDPASGRVQKVSSGIR